MTRAIEAVAAKAGRAASEAAMSLWRTFNPRPGLDKQSVAADNRVGGERDGGEKSDDTLDGEQYEQELATAGHVPAEEWIWAVGAGRCVGLFKLSSRVEEVTFGYNGRQMRKCRSREDAARFLMRFGIAAPRTYWTSTYESGSLLAAPEAVVGKPVCFPVGRAAGFYTRANRATVTATLIERDRRVWKVSMPDGTVDTMTEWPLLCGLKLCRSLYPADALATAVYAVRGTTNDGIVRDPLELPARLRNQGPSAECDRFDSVHAARAWINEGAVSSSTFYAVRGGDNDGVVSDVAHVSSMLSGGNACMREFSSKEEAERWIARLQFFAVKFSDGSVEIVEADKLSSRVRGKKGVKVEGPVSSEREAREKAREWEAPHGFDFNQRIVPHESEAEAATSSNMQLGDVPRCIARLPGGVPCASPHDLRDTLLGPLCPRHAQLCKEGSAGSDKESKASGRLPSTKGGARKMVSKPVPSHHEDLTREDAPSSPASGIRMPDQALTLARKRAGKSSVIALRTFPDSQRPDAPAGSIWLSSEQAEDANVHGGAIRMFGGRASETHNIFDSIHEAETWIKEQLTADADEDIVDEFMREMEAARNKRAESAGSKSTKAKPKQSTKPGAEKGGAGGRKQRRGGGGGGDPGDDGDESGDGDDPGDTRPPRGAPGSRFRRSKRAGVRGKGLRSRGSVLLDKKQARVEKLLFCPNASVTHIYSDEVPFMRELSMIPRPGQAGALTTSKDERQVITFNNDMEATMAEKTFKSFDAFSLHDLMEFQQVVQYVAQYQPDDAREVTESVVEGVRVICANAIQAQSDMRDSGTLGTNGENFRAYTYLQVMYLVMFREVFEGAISEMFWATYAAKFAVKVRGAPGMAPWKGITGEAVKRKLSKHDRCLLCGKAGHFADDPRHADEAGEFGTTQAQDRLRTALANIAKDKNLSAADKKRWSVRTRAFWATVGTGDRGGTP